MCPSSKCLPAQRRRGGILIVVLGFIILLSFIVTAFIDEAISKIKYYGLFHHREDLRVEAYSALETALATINAFAEADDGLVSPAQGWENPLAFVNYVPEDSAIQVKVAVEDISGKLALADLSQQNLTDVFIVLGVSALDASDYAAAIIDWMDEDDLNLLNSFDGDDYLREDPPYRAANQPLRTWDELRLILGVRDAVLDEETGLPNLLYRQITDIFTLETGHAVNINTASPLVLTVLEEMGLVDAAQVRSEKAGFDGVLGTADDQFLRESGPGILQQSNLFGFEVAALKVSAEARRGEAFFLVEALVSWQGAGTGSGANRTEQRDDEEADEQSRRGRAGQRREEQPKTVATEASALGYPFQIERLRENRKL